MDKEIKLSEVIEAQLDTLIDVLGAKEQDVLYALAQMIGAETPEQRYAQRSLKAAIAALDRDDA